MANLNRLGSISAESFTSGPRVRETTLRPQKLEKSVGGGVMTFTHVHITYRILKLSLNIDTTPADTSCHVIESDYRRILN
jgi:hypothetical protein